MFPGSPILTWSLAVFFRVCFVWEKKSHLDVVMCCLQPALKITPHFLQEMRKEGGNDDCESHTELKHCAFQFYCLNLGVICLYLSCRELQKPPHQNTFNIGCKDWMQSTKGGKKRKKCSEPKGMFFCSCEHQNGVISSFSFATVQWLLSVFSKISLYMQLVLNMPVLIAEMVGFYTLLFAQPLETFAVLACLPFYGYKKTWNQQTTLSPFTPDDLKYFTPFDQLSWFGFCIWSLRTGKAVSRKFLSDCDSAETKFGHVFVHMHGGKKSWNFFVLSGTNVWKTFLVGKIQFLCVMLAAHRGWQDD